jgi:chloramphenicol-sensitive protein RarD
LQYLTPTLQLLCGVVLLGEHMSPARWAGFGLVWVALVVLTADSVRVASRRRTEARVAEPVGAA